MIKVIIIILAALLLSSAAPRPAALPPATIHARAAEQPSQVQISAVVYGSYPGGLTGPIGEYTAVGASLGEATANAQSLEQQIRAQATAQAVHP